jgi:hypothetical protein
LKAAEPDGQTKTRGKDLLREQSEQLLSFGKNDAALGTKTRGSGKAQETTGSRSR